VAAAALCRQTRAAEHLHISPPSLTEQIKNLEEQLGARLFARTKRNVALTDAGASFLVEARSTLQQAERAERVAKLAGRGELGRVEIGYVGSSVCSGLLATLVAGYRKSHPLVNLTFRFPDGRHIDHLAEGRLDIAFITNAARYPVGISAMVLEKQGVMIALPRGHRLAASAPIAHAMLAEERFIAPVFESLFNLPSPAALGLHGKFTVKIVDRAPDLFTFLALVASGAGIALVPQSWSFLKVPGVIYKSISPPAKPVEFVMAFRRDERSPAVKAFIQHVRKYRLS
jgi:DNA-binding transcriptional LysR family regulator